MIETLFQEIEAANKKTLGWASLQKQIALAAAIVTLRPNYSLEIGVWCGKSFIPMAMAHRAVANGIAIGVDPWLPAASAANEVKANVDWWGNLDHEWAFRTFTERLTELELPVWAQVNRMDSSIYNPPDGIGVLSIDGNHGPQAILDVERYAPKVSLGGLVFMDDTRWEGGNVTKAINLLPTMGFEKVYAVQNHDKGGSDDWAVFERMKT